MKKFQPCERYNQNKVSNFRRTIKKVAKRKLNSMKQYKQMMTNCLVYK